jgi:hypothetical protein
MACISVLNLLKGIAGNLSKYLVLMLAIIFCHREASAQNFSNIRKKNIQIVSDTIKIDTVSVIPNTLQIFDKMGQKISSDKYDLYPFSAILVWKEKPIEPIEMLYRAYPMMYANKYFHRDFDRYQESQQIINVRPFSFEPVSSGPNDFLDFGNLEYSGNFSRGLSFGSNQDVVLNSVLNLQLQGKLSDEIEVVANVTDNNIPIQPDGNTQRLQEFDKIFIQLRRRKQSITLGDFDMIESQNYFMRYSKKTQGARIDGEANLKKSGILKIHAGGGISRGKFARNTLTVTEGNQGPYKLLGANNESFIIILANTEEVFINGVKQVRGFDKDYIIDYNTCQITFTPRRLITKDLRIIVEFEYTERSYQRTMADADLQWLYKKTSIGFNLYTEQDSKNQNVQQNLDAEKKNFLAGIGDNQQDALFPGIDTASYDPNRILYRKVDTSLIIDGNLVDVILYEKSTDPVRAIYSLTFSLVGEGRGNYIASTTTANGRVYQYSPPQINAATGQVIQTGNYEPVVRLVAPNINQLYTLNLKQKVGKYIDVKAEGALSYRDNNLFSNRDDDDNIGGGVSGSVGFIKDIDKGENKKNTIRAFSEYEFINKDFVPIERYRLIEFYRDFNLDFVPTFRNEHIAKAGVGYSIDKSFSADYKVKTFIQDSVYTGFEHKLITQVNKKGLNLTAGGSFLHSKCTTEQSILARPAGEISYTFDKLKGWKTGINFFNEINKTSIIGSDSLDRLKSHIWHEYRYFIESPDTLADKYRIEYFLRIEQPSVGNQFTGPDRIGHNISFTGNINTIKNQNLQWTFTYRRLEDKDSIRAVDQLKNYYLGRIDYSFNIIRGFLKSNTFYELGTGQEQKLQLIYVASPTNKGDFIWQGDANNNGIKDITEFVPLKFQTDTSYIRTFQSTLESVPVNTTQFNQSLNINPAVLIRNSKNFFAKTIKLFSFFTSVQLSKKIYTSLSNRTQDYFSPIQTRQNDTNVVQQSINSRNSIFFNRFSSKINAQIDINYLNTKTLLTSGIENRLISNQTFVIRWNIWKQLLLETNYNRGFKANQSDFFQSQQFKIDFNETKAELSYLYKNMLRVGVNYNFIYRLNNIPLYGGQNTMQHHTGVDLRFSKSGMTTVSTKFTFASVVYNKSSAENAQAEFALLEGLRGGNNYIWNVSVEQKLTSLLQLIVGYDGRKTGSDRVVHTARAEIRALF